VCIYIYIYIYVGVCCTWMGSRPCVRYVNFNPQLIPRGNKGSKFPRKADHVTHVEPWPLTRQKSG